MSNSLWLHGPAHGILQVRTLEWVAVPFSRGSSQPRNQTQVSPTAGRFFTSWTTREAPGLMVYDVYLLCELYLLSLKIFIFASFKNNLINLKKKSSQELPWCLSDKESACQCRRFRFDPCSRKIPHVLEQFTTTEPTCGNYWSPLTLKFMLHSRRSHWNKKTSLDNQRVAPTCCN